MFENRNNNQNNTNEPDYNNFYDTQDSMNYVNYPSSPNPNPNPNRGGGGKKFLKFIAGVAAVAIVSVSSIELYKTFGTKDNSQWVSSESSSDDESSENLLADSSDSDSEKPEQQDSEKEDSSSSSATANSTTNWINMAAPEDALSIPEIAEKAMPSTVGISSVFEYTPSGMDNYWGFGFYGFGNNDATGQTQQVTGTGTGIIMSEDGYVITNAHCIYDNESQYQCGKAVSVSVVMADEDETEYDAQIVGYDLETDLAVLKIDATGLVPAEFGNSDDLKVGELVVAVGNPLGFELQNTVTCGIVSALNREVSINEREMTLIQTDTAINSGNSGGPLLNAYGQVIGINSAKMSSTFGSSEATIEGLGFAIPISSAKDILEDLINNGYVTGRPSFGITGVNITESDAERFSMPIGVYVYAVTEGSAAEQAGIRQGDVITAVEGEEITDVNSLNDAKSEYNAGDTITLTVYRSGETIDVELTLQETHQEN